MDKDGAVRRLKNVEGHVRGIAGMVEQDAYCVEIIRQIQAAQAALGKVAASILDDHLHSCLLAAVRGEDPQEREKVLTEIAEIYSMAAKAG